jgi:hypothetical protein
VISLPSPEEEPLVSVTTSVGSVAAVSVGLAAGGEGEVDTAVGDASSPPPQATIARETTQTIMANGINLLSTVPSLTSAIHSLANGFTLC